jgi:hypothetical protein
MASPPEVRCCEGSDAVPGSRENSKLRSLLVATPKPFASQAAVSHRVDLIHSVNDVDRATVTAPKAPLNGNGKELRGLRRLTAAVRRRQSTGRAG